MFLARGGGIADGLQMRSGGGFTVGLPQTDWCAAALAGEVVHILLMHRGGTFA